PIVGVVTLKGRSVSVTAFADTEAESVRSVTLVGELSVLFAYGVEATVVAATAVGTAPLPKVSRTGTEPLAHCVALVEVGHAFVSTTVIVDPFFEATVLSPGRENPGWTPARYACRTGPSVTTVPTLTPASPVN